MTNLDHVENGKPETDHNSLFGKTCLVTGASSGLGKETAHGLARAGATVLLVARDRERGEAALAEIGKRSSAGEVDLFVADLASQSQVRDLAAHVLRRHQRLDVLINNAAAVNPVRRVTEDGLEATVALNHTAPFLLTQLLQEPLSAAAPSRVINVTSHTHKWVKAIPWDDLQNERNYQSSAAYNLSKLMNVLFTAELARRWTGTGVSANCVHPGWPLKTGLGRASTGIPGAFDKLTKLFAVSAEHGARTQLYLATSANVAPITGAYRRQAVARGRRPGDPLSRSDRARRTAGCGDDPDLPAHTRDARSRRAGTRASGHRTP